VDDSAGDLCRRDGWFLAAGAVGLEVPAPRIESVIWVVALPMSICPQAIRNARPSRAVARVKPVTACLARNVQ
jgi:hypothetical protein